MTDRPSWLVTSLSCGILAFGLVMLGMTWAGAPDALAFRYAAIVFVIASAFVVSDFGYFGPMFAAKRAEHPAAPPDDDDGQGEDYDEDENYDEVYVRATRRVSSDGLSVPEFITQHEYHWRRACAKFLYRACLLDSLTSTALIGPAVGSARAWEAVTGLLFRSGVVDRQNGIDTTLADGHTFSSAMAGITDGRIRLVSIPSRPPPSVNGWPEAAPSGKVKGERWREGEVSAEQIRRARARAGSRVGG